MKPAMWVIGSHSLYMFMRMLSKWPCISSCGDYWQQAELRTDGAHRIMMMMNNDSL